MSPIWNMEEDEGDRLQKRINKILETRLDTEKVNKNKYINLIKYKVLLKITRIPSKL